MVFLVGCAGPPRSPDPEPPAPVADAAPAPAPVAASDVPLSSCQEEAGTDVRGLTPLVLEQGVATKLPGTTQQVTLLSWRIGERFPDQGQGPASFAELLVRDADGSAKRFMLHLFRACSVLGTRVYVDGTRDAVFLFVVPPGR